MVVGRVERVAGLTKNRPSATGGDNFPSKSSCPSCNTKYTVDGCRFIVGVGVGWRSKRNTVGRRQVNRREEKPDVKPFNKMSDDFSDTKHVQVYYSSSFVFACTVSFWCRCRCDGVFKRKMVGVKTNKLIMGHSHTCVYLSTDKTTHTVGSQKKACRGNIIPGTLYVLIVRDT